MGDVQEREQTRYNLKQKFTDPDHHKLPDGVQWPPDKPIPELQTNYELFGRDVPAEKVEILTTKENVKSFGENPQVDLEDPAAKANRGNYSYASIAYGDLSKFADVKDIETLIESDNACSIPKHEIFQLFKKNEHVTDKQINEIAHKLDMDPKELRNIAYGIISSILYHGKSIQFGGRYDEEELRKGEKIEMEHTNDLMIARKIAQDHLAEISDYYTRLEKMESEAEKT